MNTINMTSFLYLYMYIYSCPYINSIHVIIKPWGDISRLTDSRTSRKSSLRRYLIPSLLQPICPVTCDVIWLVSSLLYWKQNRLLQWRNSKKITAGSIKLPLFEPVLFIPEIWLLVVWWRFSVCLCQCFVDIQSLKFL